MPEASTHIDKLKADLAESRISRREFVRYAALLGMSTGAAYATAGLAPGAATRALAQDMPTGGTLRIGSRIKDIKSPHTYSWGAWDSNISRQVVEYLTLTDENNVTHPYLLEKWEATPDLKTWTLFIRPDIKWHNGKDFTADDVIWNIQRVLDPAIGSSVLGLMKGYMLVDAEENGQPTTKIWDA